MASPPPLTSLRLLVPPLRLLTAAMWQLVQRRSVKHYGMLEDFVSLVTEAVPQLLTDRQRSLLLLALRAQVTLSDPADLQVHLDRIQSISESTLDRDVGGCCSALSGLALRLAASPSDSRRLLQEVFGPGFDSALRSLVCGLLSRLEQLLPVPDFRQTASWLDAAPAALEDCVQEVEGRHLKELLTNRSCRRGGATTTVGAEAEMTLLSACSHPLLATPPDGVVQSDGSGPRPDSPPQLDVVKEEVVVRTEGPRPQEAGPRSTAPPTQQEASNQSSAAEGQDAAAPVVDVDRGGDSPGHVDGSSSDATASPLHCISHNSQRVAHRCPQCGKCFIYRSQVIRHLRSNRSCRSALTKATPTAPPHQPRTPAGEPRPPGTLSCFQCGGAFGSEEQLLAHQRSHRSRPVFRCSQCDKAFQHLSSLTNHRQTHLDRDAFVCGHCGRAFGSSRERDVHRLQHRPPDLACSVCGQTFGSQTLLLRHLQAHSAEGAEPRYRCRFCEQSFSGMTQLRIHQRTHASRAHRCDQCGKSYGSLTGLHAHRAGHGAAGGRFLCPQCGKRFKTRDGLEGHLRTHSGERPYRCPYCPKDFTALAGLNVHVRRHTGERPYVCTVCGKGWPSGGDLQKHMRTHTGERPYVCPDCGRGFSISCHLTEHRRIHTGEKPFTCPECGKCLRRKFDLKKHLLSHSSVRPHTCSYCPKSYTRRTHLNRHLLTHSGADGSREEEERE